MSTTRKFHIAFLAFLLFATVCNLIAGHNTNAVFFTVTGVIVAISYWVQTSLDRRDLKQYPYEVPNNSAVFKTWQPDEIFDWEKEED